MPMRAPATAGPITRVTWALMFDNMIALVRWLMSTISAVIAIRDGARIEMVAPPTIEAAMIIQ